MGANNSRSGANFVGLGAADGPGVAEHEAHMRRAATTAALLIGGLGLTSTRC